jgi:transcriptional repressor NrdR
MDCGSRFTTYEKVEKLPLVVVKKNGDRQIFDRGKILDGLIRACEKRPVAIDKLERLVDDVEKQLRNTLNREVHTSNIGELVMDRLRLVDEVAYVRFASVYRQFSDVGNFMRELQKLMEKQNNSGGQDAEGST